MLSAMLARYPARVVDRIMDPFNGLPATSKFLPTISEVREACEREMAVIAQRRASEERVSAQLFERDRMAAMTDGERRREVVRKWRESIAAQEAAKAPESPQLADARRVSDPEQRAKVQQIIEGKLAERAAFFAANPCVLSPEARAAFGLAPLMECEAAS